MQKTETAAKEAAKLEREKEAAAAAAKEVEAKKAKEEAARKNQARKNSEEGLFAECNFGGKKLSGMVTNAKSIVKQ